jgi:predicted DNA binding CopG/RHH family protein
MKLIKFSVNENAYEEFISHCKNEDITTKRMLNVLLSQDNIELSKINDFSAKEYTGKNRTITLKVNEELYKGVMKNSGKLDVKSQKYVQYLIYQFLK